jgi:hypothetical protein
VFLSTLPASARERRFAWLVVLGLFGLFLLAAPFAKMKVAEVWAFIPSYQSALLVNDLITAILLFAQFAILGSLPLLVLAGGYLFAAFITVPHALSFPRLFAVDGLIGAGPQTTAWLYVIWHAGFPLAVIGYALLRDSERVRRPVLAIGVACAVVLAVVGGATLLTTTGHDLLPAIMHGDGYTSVLPIDRHGLVADFRGAARVVGAASLFGARRVDHGGHVDVAVRHRPERVAQCRPLRRRVLCRPRLRSDGRDPGAAGAADRDRRGLCPAGAFL